MESQFQIHCEPYAGIASVGSPIALTTVSISSFLVISFNILSFLTAVFALLLLLLISVLTASEASPIKTRLKV